MAKKKNFVFGDETCQRLADLAKARRASERQVVEDLILSASGSGLPSVEVQAEIRARAEGRRQAAKVSAKKGRAEAEKLVERAQAAPKPPVSDTVRRQVVPKPSWQKGEK